jgi:sec-independent protein translocase protein TatB
MFDISWTEFLLIGVVALIVIGPKELPGVLRTLGQWTRKVRSMAADFQNQFHEAMREAEMADLKKQVDDLAQDFTHLDPLKSVRENVESIGNDLKKSLDPAPEQSSTEPETATAAMVTPVVGEPTALPAADAPMAIEPAATPAADAPMPILPVETRAMEPAGAAAATPESDAVPTGPDNAERTG